jgi:hypothetical protein
VDPNTPARTNAFRAFLKGLPAHRGYCVECLSRLYEKPSTEIRWLLIAEGLTSNLGECGNCANRKDVYRPHRSW